MLGESRSRTVCFQPSRSHFCLNATPAGEWRAMPSKNVARSCVLWSPAFSYAYEGAVDWCRGTMLAQMFSKSLVKEHNAHCTVLYSTRTWLMSRLWRSSWHLGMEAMRRASVSVAASSSGSGTHLLTKPIRCASRPSIVSPERVHVLYLRVLTSSNYTHKELLLNTTYVSHY